MREGRSATPVGRQPGMEGPRREPIGGRATSDAHEPLLPGAHRLPERGGLQRGHSDIGRSRSLERLPKPAPRRTTGSKAAKAAQPLIPKAQTGRKVTKTVFLPLGDERLTEDFDGTLNAEGAAQSGAAPGPDVIHPVRVYCVADSFNLKKLSALLRIRFPESEVQTIYECTHCKWHGEGRDSSAGGEMFFFEYGVAIFWELQQSQCKAVLDKLLRQCSVCALSPAEAETDDFGVKYIHGSASSGHQSIANDIITISRGFQRDYHVKMAMSHALAQSTKLCLYEARVGELVNDTKDMPERLATYGKVGRTRKQIAQLIGKVFIQKSNVNLMSTVLDTPEYFWSAPDQQQILYKRICEYLELESRVSVLNNRFEVLTELLNIVREHENNLHTARLEWIVIWLIVVEVVVGLMECASILGVVTNRREL